MLKIIETIKEKYLSLNVVIRATVWFTFANLFIRGLSLITVPVFTRLLPVDQYGELTLFYSSISIILIFSGWDISYGAYLKGLFKYQDNTELFTATTTLFTSVMTIFLSLLLLVFRKFFSNLVWIPYDLFPLVVAYLLLQPVYRNWTVYKQKDYEYRPVVGMTVSVSVSVVIVCVAALLVFPKTSSTKIVAEYAVYICFYLPFFLRALKLGLLRKNIGKVIEQIKYIVHFQAPCILHSLSLVLLGQADRIMIGRFVGSASAALYGVAYNFSNVIIIFQNSLEQAMGPWRYRKLGKEQYSEINSVSNSVLLLVGCLVECFVLVAPEVFKILLTDSYYESIWCVPPIALSVVYIYMYSLFVSVESYYEETKYIMYTSVTCTVINIILNYFAIEYIGYIACGYTTLISYMLFAVAHYIFMRRVCRKYISGKIIFVMKTMVGIAFGVSAIVIGTTLLYPHPYIRYCFLAVLAAVLFACREKLMAVVATIRDLDAGQS